MLCSLHCNHNAHHCSVNKCACVYVTGCRSFASHTHTRSPDGNSRSFYCHVVRSSSEFGTAHNCVSAFCSRFPTVLAFRIPFCSTHQHSSRASSCYVLLVCCLLMLALCAVNLSTDYRLRAISNRLNRLDEIPRISSETHHAVYNN